MFLNLLAIVKSEELYIICNVMPIKNHSYWLRILREYYCEDANKLIIIIIKSDNYNIFMNSIAIILYNQWFLNCLCYDYYILIKLNDILYYSWSN